MVSTHDGNNKATTHMGRKSLKDKEQTIRTENGRWREGQDSGIRKLPMQIKITLLVLYDMIYVTTVIFPSIFPEKLNDGPKLSPKPILGQGYIKKNFHRS